MWLTAQPIHIRVWSQSLFEALTGLWGLIIRHQIILWMAFFLKPHSLLSNQSKHLYLLPFTQITIIKLSSLSINSWCLISNSTLWLVKWYLNLPTGLETDLIFTKGNTFWPFKQSLALKYGLTNNQQKRKAVSSFYFWQKYVQIMV